MRDPARVRWSRGRRDELARHGFPLSGQDRAEFVEKRVLLVL